MSLIVTSYNSELFLTNFFIWIAKVRTYFQEIIIIDDHSDDDSLKIIKNFSQSYENVIIFQTKVNTGRPSIPRNIGVSIATSERLVFLDIGDLLPVKYIKFLSSQSANDIFCGTKVPFLNESVNYEYDYDLTRKRFISRIELKYKNTLPFSGSSLPRSIAKSLNFENCPLEDWLYWKKITKLHQNIRLIKFTHVPIFWHSALSLSPKKIKQISRISNINGLISIPLFLFFAFNLRFEEWRCKKILP